VSGGYGPGGYPGQGYDEPDYDDRGRPRQPGRGQQSRGQQPLGQQPRGQQRDGSARPGDRGPGGHDGQPGYGGQAYGDPGYDPRGYGQPDGPGYPPPGPGGGGYNYPDPGQYQDNGPQPGQYGAGHRRTPGGYDQRGDNRYGQGGYDAWQQDQGDNSFLPGFGGQDGYDGGRPAGRAPERDDRRGRPGGPGGRDAGDRGASGPGPRDGAPREWDNREWDNREWDNRDRDNWGDWNDADRKPRKKATRWLPRILILVVVAAIVIGGLVGGLDIYGKYQSRYHPADYAGPGTGNVTVQVMSGDTAFSLAPKLLQLGVIASTRAFTNAAEAATSTTSSSGLQAGFYQLHEHMQASLAYAAVTNPKNVVQTTVTIPEGKRAVDVIAILAKKTKIPLKDFQQALANPARLGLPSYANGKVEGYLFPATYAVVPHESALQILQAMVQRYNVEAQAVNLVAAAKAAGLTPTQLVIEASLAQAEGGSVSDYPKIAEVIHNRLAIGMHLQFDSTVLYGLGKYAVSATIKQTKTPGPYNTYLNAGLPAGPISNPGDAAIQGVLHPAHGNDLYFLTKPGGKSEFSPTPLKGQ
jgi:peptidoglycan lytic transglycosylase G